MGEKWQDVDKMTDEEIIEHITSGELTNEEVQQLLKEVRENSTVESSFLILIGDEIQVLNGLLDLLEKTELWEAHTESEREMVKKARRLKREKG